MEVSEYQSLMSHMEWADALAWTAVLGVPSLRQDRQMRERLHHYHSTQWAYLQVWRGEELRIPELSGFADLRALGRWARGFYLELPAYATSLQPTALQREVEFPWAAQLVERLGSAKPASLADTVLQLALHSAHHRGQVLARLRELESEPPLIDFIAWIWMGRPKPQWESLEAP